MAIGDTKALPVQAIAQRIDLPFGDSDADLRVNYPIEFDKNEWEITAVAFGVSAAQTYSIGSNNQANLDLKVFIVSESPNGSAQLGATTIRWDAFDALNQKSWNDVRNVSVQGTAPDRVYVQFYHNYRIALPPITVQSCAMTDYLSVVLKQKVDNPTTQPVFGNPTTSTTQPPAGGGWDIGSFFGGLGTGALIAGAAIVALLLFGPGRRR